MDTVPGSDWRQLGCESGFSLVAELAALSLSLSLSAKPWPAASIYNIWNLSFIIQQRRGGDEHGCWLGDKRVSVLGNSCPICACALFLKSEMDRYSLLWPVNKIDSDLCFQCSPSQGGLLRSQYNLMGEKKLSLLFHDTIFNSLCVTQTFKSILFI